MAKIQQQFVCQECGGWHSKWSGRCDTCGAWNSIVEESIAPKQTARHKRIDSGNFFSTLETSETDTPLDHSRILTGIAEFDRVCGGGLVPGSVILVGGDPGIGKSTLLLQVVASLSQSSACAYISGEEALSQLRLRAERLKVNKAAVHMASSTQLQDILVAIDKLSNLKLTIIDSIQTMISEDITSAAGTVSQVRACTQDLIASAKKQGHVVILVGHVTKEGVLAGPRVLEHMVDTVLYFEGERNYDYRILRSVKNRFGATDEIGVFAMGDQGLTEVRNPSELFLANHQNEVSGTAIFAGMEGTRPILLEIQALVAPSYLASPRRTAVGWDSNRLSMILAVLEARCGLSFGNKDIYLNVAGGLKITEPAADLAVAAALISAIKNQPVPSSSIYFGEIGLTGEVRPVSHSELRFKEAEKLGFSEAFCASSPSKKTAYKGQINIHPLKYLLELVR
ncbi:MAG: DNA repair protein RadA [Alphaproteobacteria bacterium]|nr:DNA repair protein RadA [Alphaproteobacteria bacterium]